MNLVSIVNNFKESAKSVVRTSLKPVGYILTLGLLMYVATGCSSLKPITNLKDKRTMDKINQLVLTNAAINQTLTFGENHGLSDDDKYVAGLLPKLRKMGYKYFAVEDIGGRLAFLGEYKKGNSPDYHNYFRVDSNTAELLVNAVDLGYTIIPLASREDTFNTRLSRDEVMFKDIKEKIYDIDSSAKVISFVGAWHATESNAPKIVRSDPQYSLGHYLNQLTNGKNFSVALRARVSHLFPNHPELDIPSKHYDLDLSDHPLK